MAGSVAWVDLKPKTETQWRFATIDRGEVERKVTATGTANALIQVSVGTQVSGVVTDLYADFNSIVKKGQVVARIDASVNETQVADAQAALRKARSACDHARADLQRARINRGYCTIKAPVDGVVVSRLVDVGQTVAASFSTPSLFSIAKDLSRMKVQAAIDEADIGMVQVGQEAGFTVDSYPDLQFHGAVSEVQINPTVSSNVVTYCVVLEVANVARPSGQKRAAAGTPGTARYMPSGSPVYRGQMALCPGMTANISILTAKKQNVLRVPNLALRFNPWATKAPSQDQLWVLNQGVPAPVPVTVGIAGSRYSEVSGPGLHEGMQVLTGTEAAKPAQTVASHLGGPPRH